MFCPHCEVTFAVSRDSLSIHSFDFSNWNLGYDTFANDGPIAENSFKDNGAISIEMYKCPNCLKHTFEMVGLGNEIRNIRQRFYPAKKIRKLPDYIPSAIIEDYEEAHSVVDLSPKASATLSRRCLQSMIRDFWNVQDKKSLFHEINDIESKVDPQIKKVLDSLRQLGNIGAHPEKDINLMIDIEPGEANSLLKFIDFLIDEWYIKRFETDKLLIEINEINQTKQEQRHT